VSANDDGATANGASPAATRRVIVVFTRNLVDGDDTWLSGGTTHATTRESLLESVKLPQPAG
jgi:hypothetical protein